MRIMCKHEESAEVYPLGPRRAQSITSSTPGCGAVMLLRHLKIYLSTVRLEAPERQAIRAALRPLLRPARLQPGQRLSGAGGRPHSQWAMCLAFENTSKQHPLPQEE